MKTRFLLAALIFTTATALPRSAREEGPDRGRDGQGDREGSIDRGDGPGRRASRREVAEGDRSGLANLKEEMAPEQWTALQASQQAWRAYHGKELKAQDALYEAMDGSMWRVAAASKAMDLERERALLLRDYIETLSER